MNKLKQLIARRKNKLWPIEATSYTEEVKEDKVIITETITDEDWFEVVEKTIKPRKAKKNKLKEKKDEWSNDKD